MPSLRPEGNADPPSCPRNPWLTFPERVPRGFPTYLQFYSARLTTPGSEPPGGPAAERVHWSIIGSAASVRRRQYRKSACVRRPGSSYTVQGNMLCPLCIGSNPISSLLKPLHFVFTSAAQSQCRCARKEKKIQESCTNVAQDLFSKGVEVRAPPPASPRTP